MEKHVLDILKKVEGRFEKGLVTTLEAAPIDIKRIPTGSKDLDEKMGGGYPVGRIIEILGGEAVGKTTLVIEGIARWQEQGLICAMVDSEHAFNKEYAKHLGVDTEKLIIAQPGTGEEALNVIEELCRAGVDVVIGDSVATMTPLKEIEGDMEDNNIGLHARMMSKGLRKVSPAASENNATVIFINQFRTNVGAYGDPNIGTGGKALPYYASVRVKLYASAIKDSKGNQVASRVKAKIAKNKTAPPHKTAEYTLVFGEGIDQYIDLIDAAVNQGLITKGGSWYKYGETSLGQGVNGVKNTLSDNPELLEEIESQLK